MSTDCSVNDLKLSSQCLICSSVVTKSSDIKVERFDSSEDEGDDKTSNSSNNLVKFFWKMVLEISEPLELIDKSVDFTDLNSIWLLSNMCDQCTSLIYKAKKIYSEIIILTKKFRYVQKQIVENIAENRTSSSAFPRSQDSLFKLARQVLEQCKINDFNGFGYPIVVTEENPSTNFGPLLSNVPQDEEDPPDSCGEGTEEDNADPDYKVYGETQEEDSDSDNELESPSQPVKKLRKSSRVTLKNRAKSTTKRYQPVGGKKSKFDRLHPEYPKLLPDPSTGKFHCVEPNCEKIFPRKDGLEGHIMNFHLKDKLYKCNWLECGKSFLKAADLQNHTDKHEGTPRWKCTEDPEICDKAFYYPGDLIRHKQIYHETEKSWICEICGKEFSCRQTLGTHKLRRHRTSPKEKIANLQPASKFICEDCGKEFTLKKNLNAHVDLVHRKFEGKFPCHFEGCKERFAWKFHLKSHLWRRHKFSLEGYQEKIRKERRTEETQCKVKGCRKPFMSAESLRRHMEKKHSVGGEKGEEKVEGEFKCKWCGKGFHLKTKLKRHEEAHENMGTKPYKCELCGKGFSIMQYLKNHLKSGVHNKM